jgi:phenylacetic acid degradation protein
MPAPRVYSFDGVIPVVHPSSFVHPSAVLIGDVIVGPNCYVGPCASLRGDFGRIVLGTGANIQDCCVMHSFPGRVCGLDDDAHVGHGAVLHGCHVGENALIGMNSVVMDNVEIGANSIVAACAFVKSGTQVPPLSLVVGAPAKVVRSVTQSEVEWKTKGTRTYQLLAQRSRETMHECAPLTAMEEDRRSIEWQGKFELTAAKASG